MVKKARYAAFVKMLALVIIVSLLASASPTVSASPLAQADEQPVELFPGAQWPSQAGVDEETYEEFFGRTVAYYYDGGQVCLSASEYGCFPPAIDDVWIFLRPIAVCDAIFLNERGISKNLDWRVFLIEAGALQFWYVHGKSQS